MVNEAARITNELFDEYIFLADEEQRNADKYKLLRDAINYLCLIDQSDEILIKHKVNLFGGISRKGLTQSFLKKLCLVTILKKF